MSLKPLPELMPYEESLDHLSENVPRYKEMNASDSISQQGTSRLKEHMLDEVHETPRMSEQFHKFDNIYPEQVEEAQRAWEHLNSEREEGAERRLVLYEDALRSLASCYFVAKSWEGSRAHLPGTKLTEVPAPHWEKLTMILEAYVPDYKDALAVDYDKVTTLPEDADDLDKLMMTLASNLKPKHAYSAMIAAEGITPAVAAQRERDDAILEDQKFYLLHHLNVYDRLVDIQEHKGSLSGVDIPNPHSISNISEVCMDLANDMLFTYRTMIAEDTLSASVTQVEANIEYSQEFERSVRQLLTAGFLLSRLSPACTSLAAELSDRKRADTQAAELLVEEQRLRGLGYAERLQKGLATIPKD
ncbi:hypothetical protein KAZ57_01120 [Patescibacteria group bacterium]|nr:hypothetical protein [Patescibacteria group bacterium]